MKNEIYNRTLDLIQCYSLKKQNMNREKSMKILRFQRVYILNNVKFQLNFI